MTAITIGSMIHLENCAANGGYLDVRGWVAEEPILGHWYDPHVLALVSTHALKNRSMGSGSWQILSASGKSIGEPLKFGDQIHLRNMYSGVGYLDTFEWVWQLAPFRQFPKDRLQIGVFTSSTPKRGGGLSGTWTVRAADGAKTGGSLVAGDTIYLENNDLGQGFLRTYGEVRDHEMFTSYDGQRLFVFKGLVAEPEEEAYCQWKVSLSPALGNLYYVWGDAAGRWLDFGAFKLSGQAAHALVGLKVHSDDEGRHLAGKVIYHGEQFVDFEAAWVAPNRYWVRHQLNGRQSERHPNGEWLLGGRGDRRIVGIDIGSVDNGRSFVGTITYAGEASIPFKGIRATTTFSESSQQTLLYNFFDSALWQARIRRIEGALETAVKELDEVLQTLDGFSLKKLADLINSAGGHSYQYLIKDYLLALVLKTADAGYKNRLEQLLLKSPQLPNVLAQIKSDRQTNAPSEAFGHLNDKLIQLIKTQAVPLLPEQTNALDVPQANNRQSTALDFEFQVKQLLNIYTLWLTMRDFWQLLGTTSIQAMEQLNEAQILPPVQRIRACYKKFTTDFEILQSAIQQRRWVKATEEISLGNVQAGSLVITDKLAALSLAPFQHLLSDAAHIIPITYFSKAIHVRKTPYTEQFVFVGLTYDLTSSLHAADQASTPSFELMAIPHEIGHFIYEHAQLKYEAYPTFVAMAAQFADNPYHHWCEELFADIYGCVIAGPFTALGLQALLATNGGDRALRDDEVHPTPAIRPFFLSEMLKVLHHLRPAQYPFAEVALMLDANWTAVLERWGFLTEGVKNGRPARVKLPDTATDHTEGFLNVDKALQNVRPIIETFARSLLAMAQDDAANNGQAEHHVVTTMPWCQKNASLPDYINQLQELSGHRFATEQGLHLPLSQAHQLEPAIVAEITSILRERNEHIAANLFQNLLDSWHDSGPGGGLGDHG